MTTSCDIDLEARRDRSHTMADDSVADRITAVAVDTFRALLRAETAADISDAMVAFVRGIGASVESPSASGQGQLSVDLSFGARMPLVPAGDARTLALLGALLPGMITDAFVAFDRVVRRGDPLNGLDRRWSTSPRSGSA